MIRKFIESEFNVGIIKELSDFAISSKSDAYVVGGYVRDYLLGIDKEGLDVDVMVIGDAVKFAEKFAKKRKRN